MKNGQLRPSPAESEGNLLCMSLREIPQDDEKFSTEGLCFLTQDVHWVKKSSGEGVCRHD
jgi:hypothetical protein